MSKKVDSRLVSNFWSLFGACDLRFGTYHRGVTLIDTVVGTALMLVVFLGVFAVFQLSVDVVMNNRARVGALALMNERMEYVRSLDYASVGTVGGIPSGPIAQSEPVTLSDIPYTRRTTIQYADDPEDGENEADENEIIVDYKQVRIEVSWSSRTGERHVVMVARVEPLNGEEVDCGTPCGTLRIDVLNAVGGPVQGALVNVVNNTVAPPISITTFTNVNGRVVLAGAPVASGYEVSVSKTGYNSAQTYASGAENSSPVPSHQQVFDLQTTSLTLGLPDSGIDYLSTKTVYTFSAVAALTWDEAFGDAGQIASSTNIAVAGGVARLSGSGEYPEWGELESDTIGHSYLAQWREFSWSGSVPEGTTVAFRFLDANGSLISDADLPGNAAGFTAPTVSLYGLSTSTHPSIIVRATLTTSDPGATPFIGSYGILYNYGPVPLGNLLFDMRGSKRIGADPVIYKYDEEGLRTNSQGVLVLQNMEWDTYDITIPSAGGYALAYSCAPQPEYLPPGILQSTSLYLTQATNALTVAVTGGAGEYVPGAEVAVSGPLYAATSTSGACGRAFFPDIVSGTYTYRVTANGYAGESSTVPVSGLTTKNVTLTAE